VTNIAGNPLLEKADIDSRQLTRDGKIAYAYRQASIRDRMVVYFSAKWKGFPSKLLHMESGDARIRIERH